MIFLPENNRCLDPTPLRQVFNAPWSPRESQTTSPDRRRVNDVDGRTTISPPESSGAESNDQLWLRKIELETMCSEDENGHVSDIWHRVSPAENLESVVGDDGPAGGAPDHKAAQTTIRILFIRKGGSFFNDIEWKNPDGNPILQLPLRPGIIHRSHPKQCCVLENEEELIDFLKRNVPTVHAEVYAKVVNSGRRSGLPRAETKVSFEIQSLNTWGSVPKFVDQVRWMQNVHVDSRGK